MVVAMGIERFQKEVKDGRVMKPDGRVNIERMRQEA